MSFTTSPAEGSPGDSKEGVRRLLLPHEWTRRRLGIFDCYSFQVDEPAPLSWWSLIPNFRRHVTNELLAIWKRVPIFGRATSDLLKIGGTHFWIVSAGRLVQSMAPPLTYFLTQSITKAAQRASVGERIVPHVLIATLAARLAVAFASQGINVLLQTSEKVISNRFESRVQLELLRLHCELEDDQLSSPEITKLITHLKGYSPHTYNEIDPLSAVGLAQSIISFVAEAAICLKHVNRGNLLIALIAGAAAILQSHDVYGSRRYGSGHPVVTNDAWLRFQTILKLATSASLRREVKTLGLRSYLLEEATASRREVGDLATNVFYQRQDWLPIVLASSTPIIYTLFALHRSRYGGSSFTDVLALTEAVGGLVTSYGGCSWQYEQFGEALEVFDSYYQSQLIERRQASIVPIKYEKQTRLDHRKSLVCGMHLEFQNVTVTYPNAKKPALDQVSFAILPGQLVAMLGANGCGKTTLISLLALQIKPDSGIILVNGKSIVEYDPDELSQICSFTFQTSPTLPFTVRDYVSLGSMADRLDDAQVRSALEAAGAAEIVEPLVDNWLTYAGYLRADDRYGRNPSGLPQAVKREPFTPFIDDGSTFPPKPFDPEECDPTLISGAYGMLKDSNSFIRVSGHSPQPTTLSGGQWQRVALAQSLMKPTHELLVLDEPAAALDPMAESAVFQKILKLKGKATVLFTTHRFGITSSADRLLVFSEGRLVEEGTHDQLLRKENGQYALMWKTQAEGFLSTATRDEGDDNEDEWTSELE